MELLPSMLLEILRHNYSMVHIPWSIAHDVRAMQLANSWDTGLPVMDAITTPQLAYDMWTTSHIKYVHASSLARCCSCVFALAMGMVQQLLWQGDRLITYLPGRQGM